MVSGKQILVKEHSSSLNEIHLCREVINTMVKDFDDASPLCLVCTITIRYD
jgi:hypothetical protein